MNDQRAIRWGILGTGHAARHFAEGLRELAGASLVAVASRTPGRAREFAARAGMPRSHDGYEGVARDPEVDVVYVASPNDRHRGDCLLCLDAGKPVLCEKPFALNAAEAEEIATAARERGLFCMEAMWMRFLPLVRELDVLLEAIGEVRLLEARLGHLHPFDPSSRLFQNEAGGGASCWIWGCISSRWPPSCSRERPPGSWPRGRSRRPGSMSRSRSC